MYQGDQIAAAAHVEFKDSPQTKLHFIGVLPHFKGLGLEKKLGQLLEKWGKQKSRKKTL